MSGPSARLWEFGLSLACMLGISSGQILFKLAAVRIDPQRLIGSALGNLWLWIAFFVYGVATLVWVHVLRTAPLSRVYPLFALAFVIVPVFEALFIGVPVRRQAVLGGLFVVAGVYISVQGLAD